MSLFVKERIKIGRRVIMKKRTFEYDDMIVNVHYEKLPTKEDLEEACSIFYRKAMEDKRKKSLVSTSDKD